MARFFKFAGMLIWVLGMVSLVGIWFMAEDTNQLGDLSVFVGAILLAAFTAFVAAYVFDRH